MIFYIIFFLAFIIKPVFTELSVNSEIHYNLLIASLVIFMSLALPLLGARIYVLKPLQLFIIYLSLSMFWAGEFLLSISYYFKYFSYVSVFYLVYLWGKKHTPVSFLNLIVYSSVIPIIYGFVQMATGDYYNFYASSNHFIVAQKAINSFFIHPNDFGVFLVAVFAVKLSFFANRKVMYQKYDWLVLLVIVFFIYQSHARVALIGMIVVGLVFFIVALKQRMKVNVFYFGFIFIVMYLFYFFFKEVGDVSSGKSMNSLWWRFMVWGMLSEHMEGAHIVFGNGLGFAEKTLLQKYSYLNVSNPHSEYVRLYLELGIIGVLAYLYTLYYGAIRAFRVIRHRVKYSDEFLQVSVITLSINASAFVMSITENILFNLSYQWVLWAVNALFFVLSAKEKCKNVTRVS